MILRVLSLSLLIAFIGFGAPCEAELRVPPLTGRVVDLAGVLSRETASGIESTLEALEREKGAQVAVLIIPTLSGETIEQFSMRVVEDWKIGRKGIDDGVLFTVAIQDRTMRIEVGYGLEGAIPDAAARRIIGDIITPYFRDGDYNGGVKAGVDSIIKLINGEELPPPTLSGSELSDACFNLFIGTLIGAMMLRTFLSPLRTGIVASIVCFAVALFLVPVVIAAVAAVIAFLVGFGASPGGVSTGGRRSGGYSSSGGGGFSGGGGSFGGGGASGRW